MISNGQKLPHTKAVPLSTSTRLVEIAPGLEDDAMALFGCLLAAKSYERHGELLKILWDCLFSGGEREVPWIIIKRLLARSLDTSRCDHRFLYDPIPSVRGGLTKTDYHLIASTKTDFQFFPPHNYFSCLWSTI